MSEKEKKRLISGIVILVCFNAILITSSVISGLQKGNVMLRFQERQTVTLFSALFLGFTALTSLYIFLLKKSSALKSERRMFWLLSAIGFFYLSMDEYFMAHEGIDEAIGSLFGLYIKHLNLDNMIIAVYGLIALATAYYFRRAIMEHKVILPCLVLGTVGLFGTVLFHCFERFDIIYEVVEESFKIAGVTFFFLAYFLALLSSLDQLINTAHSQPKRQGYLPD
ncbi:hypothetical protein ACFL1D_04515 [Candidatus Omnitrophota bacterium]